MRRLTTIPALLFVALLVGVLLLIPQSWVDAATGRLADLKASTRALANAIALNVALVDGNGDHITSVGGTPTGSSGVPNASVVTVQGITGGTAIYTLPATQEASAFSPMRITENGTDFVTFPVSSCDDPAKVTSVAVSVSTSGNSELVALTSSQVVYVCGYQLMADGAVDVQFIYGTGTACATGEADLTGLFPFDTTNGVGISVPNGGGVQFKTAASNALCIELSASVAVTGVVTYVKQ